jgi:hypothetical protein
VTSHEAGTARSPAEFRPEIRTFDFTLLVIGAVIGADV